MLDQKIDSLRLITATEKLKTISALTYSKTLEELKHFLKLIDYLRNYVHRYAQLTKSLQNLKTLLLKQTSIKESSRKTYTFKTKLDLSSNSLKMKSFETLKSALNNLNILIHFNLDRTLWLNLNVFKKFDFEVIIFHIEKDATEKWSSRIAMKSIMFLSRLLTSTEFNYWFTKLELARLIWVVKKVRHLINFFKHSIIIQIDHFAIVNLVKQKSIVITILIMRMNNRLIRAS